MTTHKIIASLGLAGALLFAGGAACAPGNEQSTESTGAASAPADTAQPTQPTQPSDTGDAVETIRVSVQDGEPSPPPDRVTVQTGQRVRIVVTSDQPDELHVHGYDESIELESGEPATLEFTADQSGLYEVETHKTGTLLFQLVVRG